MLGISEGGMRFQDSKHCRPPRLFSISGRRNTPLERREAAHIGNARCVSGLQIIRQVSQSCTASVRKEDRQRVGFSFYLLLHHYDNGPVPPGTRRRGSLLSQ